jgi:hypothetical protein
VTWLAESEGPPSRSLEDRASLVLKILAVVNVAGVVLAMIPGSVPKSALHAVMFNLAAAGLAILYLLEAMALDRGRPWAVTAVRPLLVVVAASGLYALAVALGEGKLRLPFDALLAIWAWLGPAGSPRPRPDRRSILLLGAALGLVAVVLFGGKVFGWGGLLDAHAADLRASVHADCGPPGAGPPERIRVVYDWSWTSTSPFPNELDIVVLGWTGVDADGKALYLLGDAAVPEAGIYSGRRRKPAMEMATRAASESQGSWQWGVELGEHGITPGHIEQELARARDDPPQPGPLTIRATYVHLGLWRIDAPSVTCSW